MKKQVMLAGILIVIGFLVLGFLVFKDWRGRQTPESSISDAVSSDNNTLSSEQTQKNNKNDIGKPIISNIETVSTPNLDKEIAVKIDLPAVSREKTIEEINTLRTELKANKDYGDGWMQLGILYKFIGDYNSAREAWEYVTVIRPKSYIAESNLGELFHYYLKDFAKAEAHMKRSIEIEPEFAQEYQKLHDLYVYSYKEKAGLADDILLDGIKKNPKVPDLYIALAGYYRDQGDKPNARKYYEKALTLDPPNKEAIQQELVALDK